QVVTGASLLRDGAGELFRNSAESFPVSAAHNLGFGSRAAEAILRPSGLKQTVVASLLWPRMTRLSGAMLPTRGRPDEPAGGDCLCRPLGDSYLCSDPQCSRKATTLSTRL